jgi:hypothetical protein
MAQRLTEGAILAGFSWSENLQGRLSAVDVDVSGLQPRM